MGKFYCDCPAPGVKALYDECNRFLEAAMPRPYRLTGLLFARGRERWGDNLLVKFALGCVALVFLCCCCGALAAGLWLATAGAGGTPTPFALPFNFPPRGPLAFSPASLPPARVGEEYRVGDRGVSGRDAGDRFLPGRGRTAPRPGAGKSGGRGQAVLAGRPEQAGTYVFTLLAQCYGTNVSGQSGELRYELVVEE
jgi:hypothetical protein